MVSKREAYRLCRDLWKIIAEEGIDKYSALGKLNISSALESRVYRDNGCFYCYYHGHYGRCCCQKCPFSIFQTEDAPKLKSPCELSGSPYWSYYKVTQGIHLQPLRNEDGSNNSALIKEAGQKVFEFVNEEYLKLKVV